MSRKKSGQSSWEKNRSLYILIGYVTAVALFYVSLEWRSGGSSFDFFDDDEYTFREDFIPITWDIPLSEEEPIQLPPVQEQLREHENNLVTNNSVKIVDETPEETEELTAVIDSIYDNLTSSNNVDSSSKEDTLKEEIINKYELDRMPEFPGGINALRRYLYRNLKYPEDALKKRMEGTVLCTFIITERGRVTDVKVLRRETPEMDAEAVRVLTQMPTWHAGIQKGKQVPVRYVMPIVFALTNP